MSNTLASSILLALASSLTASHVQSLNKLPATLAVKQVTGKAAIQLAHNYAQQNIQEYLVSEKYDGVRAIWKNGELRTRAGNIIPAPEWFTKPLPKVWLDGELWIERGQFERMLSTLFTHHVTDDDWKQVKYMVFDAPNTTQAFEQRAAYYRELIANLNVSHVEATVQRTFSSKDELFSHLQASVEKGAEGLMLHRKQALFVSGRSTNLLKLKPYFDAEAKVIEHIPGRGKFADKMGSLLVEFINKENEVVWFKIGSGFSDKQRAFPPALGSVITFKYHGFTRSGVPKFATFLRECDQRC